MEKKIEEISKRLIQIEEEIDYAIVEQLQRIGRTVKIDEFDHVPFRWDIQDYVQAIRLEDDNNIIVETSFADVKEKRLEAFTMEYEMHLDDMLHLLGMLVEIPA